MLLYKAEVVMGSFGERNIKKGEKQVTSKKVLSFPVALDNVIIFYLPYKEADSW
jgi:hypothetical protein